MRRSGIDKAEMALSVANITRRERRSGGQTNAQKAGIQRGKCYHWLRRTCRQADRKQRSRLRATGTISSQGFTGNASPKWTENQGRPLARIVH